MFDNTILRKTLTATVAALALLAASSTAGARNAEATYTDATADATSAPDIQGVTVSDDASGKLVFKIQTDQPTRPADTGVFVYVNADKNLGTGGYNDGIEYVFGLDNTGFAIARVTSSGAIPAQAPGAGATWQGGVVTITVNRRDLGGTSGFTFFVASANASSPGTLRDDAPNTGMWSYTPTSTIAIKLIASKVIPNPIDSTLYSVGMFVQRTDTGKLVGKEGKVQCTARIGTPKLAVALSEFVPMTSEGTKMTPAMCAWKLPAGSRGKTLHGTITASYGGASVSRTFSAKIG